jgi:hypothetical protein
MFIGADGKGEKSGIHNSTNNRPKHAVKDLLSNFVVSALVLGFTLTHDTLGSFAMFSAPLGGGGAAAWSHPLAPPALAPDTSLAKASLPHSNDRIGGSRNSTQPGNTVANRKAAGGVPGGGGGGSSRGAVVAPGGSEHSYAFVGNNPVGAIDPLGLDLLGLFGIGSSGGSGFDQSQFREYEQYRGLLEYQRTGQPNYLSYWNDRSAWDFNSFSDTIDYLHFDYRFSDTRAAIDAGRSSLLGFGLPLIKSGIEWATGRDLWTGQYVDRESSFQSFALEATGFSLSAGLGFARSSLSTTITRSSFMPSFGSRSLWSDFAAKTAPEVVWNNGWRTLDGKFASPLGAGRSGAAAEQAVWDAISQKPGWSVIEGRVSVRNAAGDLRVYDGAAVSPRGRVIGLEVKSGSATRTGAQSAFDAGVNTFNPAVGVGQNSGLQVGRSILITVP